VSKIHWIVYAPGIALIAAGVAAAIAAGGLAEAAVYGRMAAALIAVLGLLSLASAWFRRWTTELAVTDRRIVYKRGFIRRHSIEMNMDKVESVDVEQSVLGRIFDFGDITVRGTGTGIEPLRGIDSPLEFRNHVTAH